MTRLWAAVALAGLTAGAVAGQPANAAKALDGKYAVVALTKGGQPSPKKLDTTVFEFAGGKLTISEGGEKKDTAEYILDPTKTPAHIDITPGKGKAVQGIYQSKKTADGTELTIAFTRDGGDRPKDFKGDDPDVMLLKLHRTGGAK